MPKSIITQTWIADLGEPRIIVIGGGFGGLPARRNLMHLKASHRKFHNALWSLFEVIIGFRDKVFIFFNWLWSYFSFSRSNCLITDQPRRSN